MKARNDYGFIETGFVPDSISTIPLFTGVRGKHSGKPITPNGCRLHKSCFECPEVDCVYDAGSYKNSNG